MNFYKELENECKSAGIECEIIPVPDELKPTLRDFAEFDKRVETRLEENRKMMVLSELYASEGMPAGCNYSITKVGIDTAKKSINLCTGEKLNNVSNPVLSKRML